MVALDKAASRQIACSGCAMQPLCAAADPAPRSLPAVDCRRRLERGEHLFTAGEEQDAVYAVRAGFLKICAPTPDAGTHIVRFLLPGDAAGMGGFGDRRHSSTAVALEATEVCEISIRRAQLIAESFPAVSVHLRGLLAQDFARAEHSAVAILHRSAPQRIAAFLLDMGRRWGERGYSPLQYRLPMERREMADYLGLTLETVSRVLREFLDRGWVDIVGRNVVLHEPGHLAQCPRLLRAPARGTPAAA